MISKELLSEVLPEYTEYREYKDFTISTSYTTLFISLDGRNMFGSINIYELAHKCILYAWDKMYEITPRVMGAEIMSLETGYTEHTILREDINKPEKFDPRFVFQACEWVLNQKGHQ